MPISTGKLSNAYYPMLAFTEAFSMDDEFQMWEKFRALDLKKKDILVSEEVVGKIKEFEVRFQLQEVGVAIVSFAIRKIFFDELDYQSAEAKVKQALESSQGGNPVHAKAIVEAIKAEIMTIVPAPEPVIEEASSIEVQQNSSMVKLPLLKAMSDYKHIADQQITSEKLKLRNSMELVRPTLSNWIRSYREELGVGFHEPVQRANFLFQTVNGKKLNNEDRAKLNLILKSIEENFPLDIDPKREMIIFPAGNDASMELAQVNTNPRPVANRFIQARAMPVGTVRPAAFAPGTAPAAQVKFVQSPAKATPANPTLANLKPLFSKAAAPEKNISGETLHFSTGHVLPAEKAGGPAPVVASTPQPTPPTASFEKNAALQTSPHPVQSIKREPGSGLSKSPYTIRPLRLRNEQDQSA